MIIGALLGACDSEEVRFCKRFTEAEAHALGTEIELLDASTEDRPVTAFEAARLLFPNYQGPNAFYKRRPGDVPLLLDMIASSRPAERTVNLRYRLIRPDSRDLGQTRRCTFLALNGSTQYMKDYHLNMLNIERALAEESGRTVSCCLRQVPEVR